MESFDPPHPLSSSSSTSSKKPSTVSANMQLSPTQPSSLWATWQLLDSMLPTGGFAHSYGLESAIQLGVIGESMSLRQFIIAVLEQTACMSLPFLHAAYYCENERDWLRIANRCHVVLSNHVTNRASVAQGCALLRAACTMYANEFESTAVSILHQLRLHSKRSQSIGRISASSASTSTSARASTDLLHKSPCILHHAPVFGLVIKAAQIDIDIGYRMILFTVLRDTISAATRLNIIGPIAACRLQVELAPITEEIYSMYCDQVTDLDNVCQPHPFLEVVQGTQDRLYSKLFAS